MKSVLWSSRRSIAIIGSTTIDTAPPTMKPAGIEYIFAIQPSAVCSTAPPALTLSALALNATTLGIPCIYYGSEQLFDGSGGSDRYLRECMFGGAFGAFRSRGRHFFREDQWLYRELASN